ncbi:chromosomal replication initiator protein DnaA [Aeromicrobium sp. 50.2.37]|uniref:chromosomal replication initiator protein DnaA n=3 Tax=unclassified Aeromicrobium TaxID=2633570 RepID=UPI00214F8B05|nr:chromosomal replication initiator protein DnaA [Aeromicrobium sp. 50.2.37]MCR4513243.1 chromosomal replication initiator protein DnaA [Aeromicrobium sp. 50.2.37]
MTEGSEPSNEVGDLAAAWEQAVSTLSMGAKVWVYNAEPISRHPGIFIVGVPDDLSRAQLESRVRPALEHALSAELGEQVRLVVTIEPALGEKSSAATAQPDEQRDPIDRSPQDDKSTYPLTLVNPAPDEDVEEIDADEFKPSWAQEPDPHQRRTSVHEARLNARYLFENFVIGSSNRFAHAAAVAAAEAPGKAYNPLVIHGDSGLGKTHLLHAIGHYVLNLYPSSRVRYVNSEEFTNDVINAIRENRTSALRQKYREIDVLLVDDIQFLENKESTQTEFFHTFNALHNANKQIVMTSDRPPKNLRTLEERLRNRFEWGLQTEMLPPDLETRIAILRKKAAIEKLTAPADVLEFIASKVQTNIRELEGALIRATAFANLQGTTVDLQLAQIVLKDLVAEGEEPEITSGVILAQTAAYSEFSIEELCGTNRSRDLVLARQIAMYLCRELTDMSLPKIGADFGGRDHTTVMHADRKIRKLMAEKHAVYNQVTELTNRIKQQARQN